MERGARLSARPTHQFLDLARGEPWLGRFGVVPGFETQGNLLCAAAGPPNHAATGEAVRQRVPGGVPAALSKVVQQGQKRKHSRATAAPARHLQVRIQLAQIGEVFRPRNTHKRAVNETRTIRQGACQLVPSRGVNRAPTKNAPAMAGRGAQEGNVTSRWETRFLAMGSYRCSTLPIFGTSPLRLSRYDVSWVPWCTSEESLGSRWFGWAFICWGLQWQPVNSGSMHVRQGLEAARGELGRPRLPFSWSPARVGYSAALTVKQLSSSPSESAFRRRHSGLRM